MPHPLSPTTSQILEILNDGAIHTGSDMADALSISRTAVWKIIQRLKKYNVEIRTQRQGYQLKAPLILLDKKKIEGLMKYPKITWEIFESIPSTSDYLKNKRPLGKTHCCLAEYQSKGKGRLGRTWISPFGRNIYCSFSYVFNKDISEMGGLSLAVGILTAQALEALNPILKPSLKWPNDIYINNQKMGGILIELTAEAHGNCTAIISIGLDINMRGINLNEVNQPWTSLEHILNEKLDRNIVVAHLLQSILKGMDIFHEKGMAAFVPEWKQYDFLENQKISINTGKEIRSGIARGISAHGNLLFENSAGNLELFSYGDTMLL